MQKLQSQKKDPEPALNSRISLALLRAKSNFSYNSWEEKPEQKDSSSQWQMSTQIYLCVYAKNSRSEVWRLGKLQIFWLFFK